MSGPSVDAAHAYPVEEWLSPHDAVSYRDYWEDEEKEPYREFFSSGGIDWVHLTIVRRARRPSC
jgi:hypothetical protein